MAAASTVATSQGELFILIRIFIIILISRAKVVRARECERQNMNADEN